MSEADKKIWEEMWKRKLDGREMFAQAELVEDKEFRKWNGHDKKPEFASYFKKAGDTVLITCMSVFGHACIRGIDVDNPVHGYDAAIDTEKLKNVRFIGDPGHPWRKELLKQVGAWRD